jgi:hypothetical protein
LDAVALRVLEGIVVFDSAPPSRIESALDADRDIIDAAYDRLFDRALIWGERNSPTLSGPVLELIGRYPAGLGEAASDLFTRVSALSVAAVLRALSLPASGQPTAGRLLAETLADPTRLAALVAQANETERAILDRLAAGPPVGTLSPADASLIEQTVGTGARGPGWLVEHGLLALTSANLVELPREVGLHLRADQPLGHVDLIPAPAYTVLREPDSIDSTGSVAVLETLRLVDALATSWTREPAGQLRSGGLGVRDLKRTARELSVSETTAAVLIEVAVAADLISAPTARDVPWLPTTDFDTWSARDPATRWVRLASTWRSMTRQPHLVGERDERGKARAALSYEIERAAAPALRGEVLRTLIDAPVGAAGPSSAVLDHLDWLMPRRQSRQRDASAAVLAEAELLGITGGGGLTSFGRSVLLGSPAPAAAQLARALPAPVDEFLLQPDLTVVVPGPPTTELIREISYLADLESAGGASVYRISEASLRRAFDTGHTAADVHALFTKRSRTPVPQALSYLIDDLARRHGVLRTGDVTSYLRCEDVSLLDRVVGDRSVASLEWHRLAPTVAVSAASTARVLDVLREGGYAPAEENSDGGTVSIGADPLRSRPRRPESTRAVLAASVRDEQLADAVRRMRTGDNLSRTAHRVSVSQDIPGVTSATTLGVLRDAIRASHQVWVSYVDTAGSTAAKIIAPISLGGGFLRGHETEGGSFLHIPLHRITSVNVLDH